MRLTLTPETFAAFVLGVSTCDWAGASSPFGDGGTCAQSGPN